MQRQSSHAGRGVEGLGHRDENRAGRLEPFDELRKIGEATGQPVDLVDHNLLDETGVDVGEQALQAWALQGSRRVQKYKRTLRPVPRAVAEFIYHYHGERNHQGLGNVFVFLDRTRSPCHARCEDQLRAHVELLRCHYNFIRRHRGLKFGSVCRTPAMQAGLVTKRLSFSDVFTARGRSLRHFVAVVRAIYSSARTKLD